MRTHLLFVALVGFGCGGMTERVGDGDAAVTSSTSSSSGSSSGRPSSSSSGFPSSSGSSSGDIDCPQDVGLTSADLDQEIGWKAPTSDKLACTSADITQLESNFKDPNLKSYFDIGKGLTPACKACVVSKDTDSHWGPIVGTAADDGQTGFVNYGACFGAVDGAACGKAVEYEQLCYSLACDQCAVTSTERAKCIQTASAGACKDFANATPSACPNFQADGKACNSILDAVRMLCGS